MAARALRRKWRLAVAVPALIAASIPVARAAGAEPTLVSINLCTDQLVLSLADPGQILGLSPYARDPARSWEAEKAGRYRILSGGAEEVLVLKPDLVFAGLYTKRATRDLLKAQGFQLVELDAARSLDEAKRQIAEVGTLVGHPDRAATAIAEINAATARAHDAASGRALTVLPLQRRGWISGRDSLMTSLLDAVGLRNAGAELGRFGRQVTLESIVALRPDLLLVTNAGGDAEDQGTALLQHPALAGLYPAGRRLVLPEKLTVCGGPMLAEALDRLAAEIRRRP